jgi:hypothetical protein
MGYVAVYINLWDTAYTDSGAQVLGLLAIIDGLAAVGLQYAVKLYGSPPGQQPTTIQKVRTYNNQALLGLATLATTTGFTDLSKIAVCLTQVVPFEAAIGIGFGLANTYVVGSAIPQFEMYLAFRRARAMKKQMRQGAALGDLKNEKGGIGMKESIEEVN